MQIARLQQLGMTAADEVKLVALRDYVLKLAKATLRQVPSSCNPTPILLSALCGVAPSATKQSTTTLYRLMGMRT